MSDKGDPRLDQATPRQQPDQLALAIDDLVGWGRERRVGDVPAPLPERRPHPDAMQRSSHSRRVGNGAGLDRTGHAVRQRLDSTQRCRELVVVAGVCCMHRNRPGEDCDLGIDRVGYARVDQAIAGEVLVGVDVTWGDQRFGCADHLRCGVPCSEVGEPPDGRDQPVHHRNRTVGQQLAAGVHRDDCASPDQQITHNTHPVAILITSLGCHT